MIYKAICLYALVLALTACSNTKSIEPELVWPVLPVTASQEKIQAVQNLEVVFANKREQFQAAVELQEGLMQVVLLTNTGQRIADLELNGDDLTAYLESLPAEQIDRMDIITNPGAKYEAEGNAGIIDIRLKKDSGIPRIGIASIDIAIDR